MSTERRYVVDRIEGELVVLVDDESGDKANKDSWELPVVDEGDVIVVKLKNGHPQWGTATVDTRSTQKRGEDAEGVLDDLKGRDPGGDVKV